MLESEKLAIAAHLHVLMRRKIGRVTDIEWLLRSEDYAREIIRIALAEPQHADVQDWALRLQSALFPPPPPAPVAPPSRPAGAETMTGALAVGRRYIGSLR